MYEILLRAVRKKSLIEWKKPLDEKKCSVKRMIAAKMKMRKVCCTIVYGKTDSCKECDQGTRRLREVEKMQSNFDEHNNLCWK